MSQFKPSSINFAIKKALKLKTYPCHICCTAEWMPCAPPCLTLHQFFFSGPWKWFPFNFRPFGKASHLCLAPLGFLTAPQPWASSKRFCKISDIEAPHAIFCRLCTSAMIALEMSASLALQVVMGVPFCFPNAFTLRLYVILFVPVRVKLTVIQLTNSTPWGSGDRDYTGPESMALSLFSHFSVSRKALVFYLFCEILCAISLTCCKVMMTLFLSCYSQFLPLLRQERCKISYIEL